MELDRHKAGLLLVLSLLGNVYSQNGRSTAMEDLYQGLLDSYHMKIYPTASTGEPTNMTMMLSLFMIKGLDASQIFETMGMLVLEWKDNRLRWDPDEHGGIKRLHLSPKIIWTPEIMLGNGAEEMLMDFSNFDMTVNHDGLIHWEPSAVFKSICEIDVTYYPSDTQSCSLIFSTQNYMSSEVNVTSRSHTVNLDSYEISGDYELIRTRSRRMEFFYDCCPLERYPSVHFTVELKRRNTYYVINLITPTVLTSGLLLTLFLCPAEYKVEIGLVVLISFRLLMLDVAGDIPKTSDHTPLLSIYLMFTMVLGTVSMIVSVLILNLNHMGDKPVPAWIRKELLNMVARLLCVGNSSDSVCDDDMVEMEPVIVNTAEKGKKNHRKDWILIANILDRFFFWIVLAAMIISFLILIVPIL